MVANPASAERRGAGVAAMKDLSKFAQKKRIISACSQFDRVIVQLFVNVLALSNLRNCMKYS